MQRLEIVSQSNQWKKNQLLLDFAVSGIRHSLQSCSFEKLQCQACSQWGNIVRVEECKMGSDNGETDKSYHPDIVFSPRTPEMLTRDEIPRSSAPR